MTIKEQCLAKIQDYIDDCDEYKDTEHRYAALVLAIVKRDIELSIKEPAAAPNTIHFTDDSWATPVPNPCKNCPTHPSNGGNGMCNCTLGIPEITC